MIKKLTRQEFLSFMTDNKEKIIKLYEDEKLSGDAIDRSLEVAEGSTLRYLKKWGVEIIKDRDTRKWKFNEHFFDEIDTEEKAYFLGMLFGDGFNNQKAGFVVLGLKEDDKDILEKLSAVIESNRPLAAYLHKSNEGFKDCMTYRLTMSSRYVCERLAELGCMQAKTFKIVWPEYLKPELYRHFIRGIQDSDGTIAPPTWGIVGTESFCERLKDIMEKECDVTGHISRATYRKVNNIRYFRVGGQLQMKKVLDWLYKDATIYMDRKYEKYQSLLKWYPLPPPSKCFNPDGSLMNGEQRYNLMVERDKACGMKSPTFEQVEKRRERGNARQSERTRKEREDESLHQENLQIRRDKRNALSKAKKNGTFEPYKSYKNQ